MWMQEAELYINLACQHEPAAVLPFLQSNDSYRVSHVLRLCQRHGHVQGQVCPTRSFSSIPGRAFCAGLQVHDCMQQSLLL